MASQRDRECVSCTIAAIANEVSSDSPASSAGLSTPKSRPAHTHKFPSFSDDIHDIPTLHLSAGPVPRAMRRRRSHLQQWIEDQHHHTAHLDADSADAFDLSEPRDDPATKQRVGTPCNPYLAYPHLGGPAVGPKFNEAGSMHSYVVVDDPADGPEGDHGDLDSEGAEHMSPPTSPVLNPAQGPVTPTKSRGAPSTLRNFHLSFRSPRVPSISVTEASTASRNSSRLSLFRSPPKKSKGSISHSKSSSLSTLNLPPRSTDDPPPTLSRGAGWKWRPSVLTHFSSAPIEAPAGPPSGLLSPDVQQPPRPSTSSTATYMSSAAATSAVDDDPRFTTPPRTMNIDSMRSRRNKSPVRSAQTIFTNTPGTSSVPSLWSGPTSRSASHANTPEASGSGSTPVLVHRESAIRILFSPKRPPAIPVAPADDEDEEDGPPLQKPAPAPQNPHIVYPAGSKGTISRLSMASLGSSRDRRKKKLVVSGIAHGDAQRTTALRLWCETFGEVTRIVRMPNSDLQVHFRKAEVAETVCRVRARVTIPSVGSVQLSWYRGDKG